jgi:hypothetical protein
VSQTAEVLPEPAVPSPRDAYRLLDEHRDTTLCREAPAAYQFVCLMQAGADVTDEHLHAAVGALVDAHRAGRAPL